MPELVRQAIVRVFVPEYAYGMCVQRVRLGSRAHGPHAGRRAAQVPQAFPSAGAHDATTTAAASSSASATCCAARLYCAH